MLTSRQQEKRYLHSLTWHHQRQALYRSHQPFPPHPRPLADKRPNLEVARGQPPVPDSSQRSTRHRVQVDEQGLEPPHGHLYTSRWEFVKRGRGGNRRRPSSTPLPRYDTIGGSPEVKRLFRKKVWVCCFLPKSSGRF